MILGSSLDKHGAASTSKHFILIDNPQSFERYNDVAYYGNVINPQLHKTLYLNNKAPYLYVLLKSDISTSLGSFHRNFRDYQLKIALDLPFRIKAPFLGGWSAKGFPHYGQASGELGSKLNPGISLFAGTNKTVGEMNITSDLLKTIVSDTNHGLLQNGSSKITTFWIDGTITTAENPFVTCLFPTSAGTLNINTRPHCTSICVDETASYIDIYISYIMRIDATGLGKCSLINHSSKKIHDVTSLSMSKYLSIDGKFQNIIVNYSVPMIAKYRFTGIGTGSAVGSTGLELLGVVNPTLDVTNSATKIDSSIAAGCFPNWSTIPRLTIVDTDLAVETPYSSWSAIANNYSTSTMIKDPDYYSPGHRLLSLVGIDPNITPGPFQYNSSTLYISAINTSDTDVFTNENSPSEGPKVIDLGAIIKLYDPTLVTKNICKLSAVKWEDNYIVAITYGNYNKLDKTMAYFTVLLQIDATVSISSTTCSIIRVLNGSAFTDLTVV